MDRRTYTIKPLKWTRKFQDWHQVWESDSAHGGYEVSRTREDCDPARPWQPWRWGYCFAEYYNEASTECASAAEGKQLAEQHWQEYLLPALIEDPTP